MNWSIDQSFRFHESRLKNKLIENATKNRYLMLNFVKYIFI